MNEMLCIPVVHVIYGWDVHVPVIYEPDVSGGSRRRWSQVPDEAEDLSRQRRELTVLDEVAQVEEGHLLHTDQIKSIPAIEIVRSIALSKPHRHSSRDGTVTLQQYIPFYLNT